MTLAGGYPGLAIYVALIWTTLWLRFLEPALLKMVKKVDLNDVKGISESTEFLRILWPAVYAVQALRIFIPTWCTVRLCHRWMCCDSPSETSSPLSCTLANGSHVSRKTQPVWTSVMWTPPTFAPFRTEVWIIVMRSVRLVLVLLLLPASQQHYHNWQIFILWSCVFRESLFSGHESLLCLLESQAFSIMFPLVVVERFLEISGMLIVAQPKLETDREIYHESHHSMKHLWFEPSWKSVVCVCVREFPMCCFCYFYVFDNMGLSWFVQKYGIYAYLSPNPMV